MEQLLDAIRAATVPNATDEIKAAGANACRALLAALEAKQGEPLAAPPPAATSSPKETPLIDATQVQAAIRALGSMQPEQLLDLAIARLRAALPAGAEVAPPRPGKFPNAPAPAEFSTRPAMTQTRPMPAAPLGVNDFAFLDYLIAKAIESCVQEKRKGHDDAQNRPCARSIWYTG
jgi:hypothetical protein